MEREEHVSICRKLFLREIGAKVCIPIESIDHPYVTGLIRKSLICKEVFDEKEIEKNCGQQEEGL